MGLITQEVEVTLCSKNINYYESLGYEISKRKTKQYKCQVTRGQTLFVKVEHLRKDSNTIIEWQCDNFECGEIHSCKWEIYNKKDKYDNRDFCKKCIKNMFPDALGIKIKEGRLKNSSFYQWCIDNDRQDILNRWDYVLNNFGPREIFSTQNIDIYFLCPNEKHMSEIKNIINITGHITNRNIDNVFTTCKECYFEKNCLKNKYPNIDKLWSDKNNTSPDEYLFSSGKKVYWKCENGIHEDFYKSINSAENSKFHCSKCSEIRRESFLQENVRLYLEELCIKYNWILNHEENCNLVCKNKNNKYILPYDNEILGNNFSLIVESHGEQHYGIVGFHKMAASRNKTTPEIELQKLQERDEYKMNHALKNGYYYLAIPYTADDENETYKTMIDDMLNYIHENIQKEN